jgi:DNA-binding GntR family transcriptional regulator
MTIVKIASNTRAPTEAGDRLVEVELAEKFEVSRQPVREALLALEKEGTVIMSPYKGAMVKPLSVAEVQDIAELRLALVSLALKPAHRHLSPADFDHAYDLAKRINREALLALEKEGTVIMSPYKGAIVKPLSVAEVQDIAELRLALISLALKPAHRHLSPADFDHAYDLAKRINRARDAKDFFEHNRQFWDTILSKAQRPILWEVFRQLDDRMTRYDPFFLKVFPTPESRPRQRETLIEIYRKGKIVEAFQAFKKIYLTVVNGLIDHLNSHEADEPTR